MNGERTAATQRTYGKLLVVFLILAGAAAGVLVSQYMPMFGGFLEKSVAQPWSRARIGLIGEHALALSVVGAGLGFLLLWLRGDPAVQTLTTALPPDQVVAVPHSLPTARRPAAIAGAAVALIAVAGGLYLALRAGPQGMQICRSLERAHLAMRCRPAEPGPDGATTVIFDVPDEYADIFTGPGKIDGYRSDDDYRKNEPDARDVAFGVRPPGNAPLKAILTLPPTKSEVWGGGFSITDAELDRVAPMRARATEYTSKLTSSFRGP